MQKFVYGCYIPWWGNSNLTKILLVMKLTILLLTAAFLNVYASGVSQTVTLSGKNVELKKVFTAIKKQTGYVVFYNRSDLNGTTPVTLSAHDMPLRDFLDVMLKNQPLDYKIEDKTIMLYRKRMFREVPPKEPAEEAVDRIVKGKVTNAKGEPLPNVSVLVSGTKIGTTTNNEGQFTLTAPDDNNIVLEISSVGYITQRVKVGSQTDVNVVLELDISGLSDVVVVGYGMQKRSNLTGSVSEIRSKDIEFRATNNTTQALQGLAPNLNIAPSYGGGASDALMSVNIRGVGSLTSSAPFIVIDGVRSSESELAALNPNNIQRISVLKDAASAAIYGSQGAFGVILIETKKGSYNKDLKLTYSNDFRLKQKLYVAKSTSSEVYADYFNVATYNYNGQTAIGEEQMAKIRAFEKGEIKDQTAPDPNNPNYWIGIGAGGAEAWDEGYANTDWMDVIFKKREFSQKHNLSLSGGSNKIFYNISGSYFNDDGALKYGNKNEFFKRYTFESNVTGKVSNWLSVSNNTRFFQENNRFPFFLTGNARSRIFHDALRFPPFMPYKTPAVYDNDGNMVVPEQLYNIPGWLENNGFTEYNKLNLLSTFKTEAQIFKGLKLIGDFSFKKYFYDETNNFKKWTFYGPDGKPNVINQQNDNFISKQMSKSDYISTNIYANYVQSFGEHYIDLVAGYQQEEENGTGLYASKGDVLSGDFNTLDLALSQVRALYNPISTWGTRGIFGRLSYNYKEKYLIEFNGRYDGSSKFEEGKRYGFFPSVAAGYNIHKERFWTSFGLSEIINSFKIRASIGQLGNQNVQGYLYLPNLPVLSRVGWIINGERPNYSLMPAIVSSGISWETALTKNIGVDFTFLNNRLSAIFDIYSRSVDNMFGPAAALPEVLGSAAPIANSASLSTKGWELTLGWKDRVSNLRYGVNFMISDNKSIITKYNNPDKVLSNWYEGQVIGEIWGFEADELFQTKEEVQDYVSKINLNYLGTGWAPGDVKYKDLNGDNKIDIGKNTKDDHGDRKIIGNSSPRYSYSIQGNASWKNFDFQIFFQGIGKRDYFPSGSSTLFWGWSRSAKTRITDAVLNYWSEDNPEGYLPRPLGPSGGSGYGKNRQTSTRYLQHTTYFRLKSVYLGYTLPSSITKGIKFVDKIQFYFNGENLLTFTKLWKNFDPELIQLKLGDEDYDPYVEYQKVYPLSRTLALGLSITF
ncbi:MAG: TonB-dependent receptor [Chitinophagaceae bacterium]|nr:TonB-dependent receptor [Chitinophagaceae bacterium]